MLRTGHGQVVFQFSCAGDPEPMYSSIGVNSTDDEAFLTPDTANDAFSAYADNLLDFTSDDVSLVKAYCQIGTDDGVISVESNSNAEAGSRNTALPPGTTFLVRKNTLEAGRGKRGRMYLPGVPEDKVDGAGVIQSGEVDAWNAGLVFFAAALVAIDGVEQLVVNHGTDDTFDFPSPIVSLTMEAKVASQRRRLRP